MAAKIVVCISAYQVAAARVLGKSFTDYEVFPSDDRGFAAFSAYMARVRRAPVYVLVDAVTLQKRELPARFRAALESGAAGMRSDHAGYLG